MKVAFAAIAIATIAISSATAQTVDRTYEGDPLRNDYEGVAQEIFAYFPDYKCTMDPSTEESELRKKFLAAKQLDPATPTISAACEFSSQRCFAKQKISICFDHGGVMLISEMKFSRKATKATAGLDYFLKDKSGKIAGVGFSKATLEKSTEEWTVTNMTDTGAWDLRSAK